MSPDRARQVREYLESEMEAAATYQALSQIELDPERAAIFMRLMQAEMRHAARWAEKLGIDPTTLRPSPLGVKGRVLRAAARRLGTRRVIPWLMRLEAGDIDKYRADPDGRDIAPEEHEHSRTLEGLSAAAPHPDRAIAGSRVAGASGSLRAAVLGVNDGLVSNFSLVMGVAGGTENADFVLLAGVAGLLAGAFSMAAGEYISMRSQRDIYEYALRKEKREIEEFPEEEEEEIKLIYMGKGLTEEEASHLASRIMADPQVALDTKAREELGLDPDELGSPWGASFSSFVAFVCGAIVPILPYIFAGGNMSFMLSATLSIAALLFVGGALAVMSGNKPYWGALRMLLAGGLAAGVTYAVGSLIGVTVSG